MARVFIPSQMRDLTGGEAEVKVLASNLRQVIALLEERFPGISKRLLYEGNIAPGIAAAIDSEISSRGLLAEVGEESEVHFLPAIAGG